MPEGTSEVKVAGTRSYGAEVIQLEGRSAVDAAAAREAEKPGVFWVPPYNHEWVIAGQGTAAAEAFEQVTGVHAVFAPCGGGGLLSGTFIASRHLSPGTRIIGVEPLNANDAERSRNTGSIVKFTESPATLADGARTLSLGDKTYPLIRQLDNFYTCTEPRLIYWTQWLQHLLKLHIEPTGAMAMEGVWQWLGCQTTSKKVLVMLSGGNMDRKTSAEVWKQDWLTQPPVLP